MEITQEVAERIINSKVLIDEALVPYKGVVVSYVGYVDGEGEPFLWEDTEEEYALVSFKAMNEYQLATAVQQYQDEDYEECVNHNLVMRMNVDKARELSAGITMGTLICHEVEAEDENGDAIMILVPKAYSPAAVKIAKKVSLSELLGKKDKKGDKKASKDKKSKDKKSKKDEIVDEEFESKKDKKSKKDKDSKKEKKAKITA